jgi:citrate lyase subunit beta/citryl-CoA lyase
LDVLRTLLSVPGIRPNMIEKARTLPVDGLMLDLEDSVPPAEKERARDIVAGYLPGMTLAGQYICVRVNVAASGLMRRELQAVVGERVQGISVPKVESASEIGDVDDAVAALERERGLPVGHTELLPWIETARGVLHAFEILNSSPRIAAVLFGADDFTRDMGIVRTKEGTELAHARWQVSLAARAAGVLALDTAYPDFNDEEAWRDRWVSRASSSYIPARWSL